jgi:hypothetical protein
MRKSDNLMQNLFKDDNYCKEQIIEARRLMGLKSTNFENLTKACTHMYLHCSEKMRIFVKATLEEVVKRKIFMELKPWLN